MKKKLGIAAAAIILLLVAGLLVGRQVAIGYLTPDFLVQQMEARWKCRAHVESVDVSIFGNATVKLEGVALGKRDAFARRQTALADRTPMETPEISVDSMRIDVNPLPLIFRKLEIRHLELNGAFFETAVRRTGKLSIERLFEEPGAGGGKKRAGDEAAKVSLADSESDPGTGAQLGSGASALIGNEGVEGDSAESEELAPGDPAIAEEEKFNAGDLPVAMVADRVVFTDAGAAIQIDASGARVTLDELQLTLTEIDVDPGKLVTRNSLAFVLDSQLLVQPREGDSEFVRGRVSGAGVMRPFDPISGEMKPEFESDLKIHGGTRLDTFPVVAKIKEILDNTDAAGIEFGEFNLRGEVLADAETRIAYAQPKLAFSEPLKVELPDTSLVIHPGSWMDTSDNSHEMKGTILASEELTGKIEGMVDDFLKEKAGAFASEGLRDTILSPLKIDERVAVEVVSSGDLGDPDVDMITPLGNLTEVIETGKMLQEAGKSLLKGLFGGDEPEPEKP